ncbi:Hypothetical protein UVM_LOCUS345 [uncultured virus]|nr:Hypothetical protein UVM_LOCUS345 [uncultured virus]
MPKYAELPDEILRLNPGLQRDQERGLVRLLQDLAAASDVRGREALVNAALGGEYSDFDTDEVCPIVALRNALLRAGASTLATQAEEGRYDHGHVLRVGEGYQDKHAQMVRDAVNRLTASMDE